VRVQEIFINLLSNAVNSRPRAGNVLLAVECERETETELCDKLTVKDSGIGISPEFLSQNLRAVFAGAHGKATAGIGGSGLGLSIVKRLVDLMHGSIEVKSKLGKGTEFVVRLTFRRQRPRYSRRRKISSAPLLQGKTILLCEDNEMNREIATAILEKNGLSVLPAENGQAGRGTISAVRPRRSPRS
jgi:DNA topoisomerase VI subunit B